MLTFPLENGLTINIVVSGPVFQLIVPTGEFNPAYCARSLARWVAYPRTTEGSEPGGSWEEADSEAARAIIEAAEAEEMVFRGRLMKLLAVVRIKV